MATKSVRKTGQHRYAALLLLAGYGWLMASGILMLTGDVYGFMYDAVLHSFFVGFVFSMIFAHGPIILPGVLGVPIKPYHPVLYVWAFVLESSLILRIAADLFAHTELRKWGGMFNGIAMLAFMITMAGLIYTAVRKQKKPAKLAEV